MCALKITTLPVYSKLAEEADVPPEVLSNLPDGWQLSKHQVETYKALTKSDYDVIFNTAMTGDGKSLSAYLPILLDPRKHVFAMYPTNELIKDQERQFYGYLQNFRQYIGSVPFTTLWGGELSRLQNELGLRTRDAILSERFRNNSAILTNPDIFNLVMNYSYGKKTLIFTEQELPYTLGIYFDYFVFDEFHLFTTPQIIAVMTAMLYLAEQSDPKNKFVFSSATPSEDMRKLIERSGLKAAFISGVYSTEPSSCYRHVLHPATLHFYKLSERASIETWIHEHVHLLVNFWKTCDLQAKGAIIVNSISTARRIAWWLENELKPHGITVGENTGLTDDKRRRESLGKDIVVGTSTIDVGVDFNINFLVFESLNAGTFLQRYGRLGRVRHDQTFLYYEAHAILPGKTPWIYSRIEKGFHESEEVERTGKFWNVIQQAFPVENAFLPYIKRWGMLQPAHVLEVLQKRKDTYSHLTNSLKGIYEVTFDASFQKARRRYWGILKGEEKGRKILDEVLIFRGSSPFQVACWDATVDPPAFVDYDLFSLVRSADYVTVSEKAYKQAAQRFTSGVEYTGAMELLKTTLGHTGELPLILRIDQFYEEHEKLLLRIGKDLSLFVDQVKVLSGFRIWEPRSSPSLPDINAILSRQYVVCYCTRHDIRDLRRMLHLPAMFPLVNVIDMYEKKYTVAFGKTALLLDSVVLKFRNKHLEDTPIII